MTATPKIKPTKAIARKIVELLSHGLSHGLGKPEPGRDLDHGAHVGLNADGFAIYSDSPIGVVDPFLKVNVKNGETFWLFMYPGTITGLRHEWAHPAFGAQEKAVVDAAYSEKWVRRYVERHCPYYTDESITSRHEKKYGYAEFMDRVKQGEIFYYGSDLHGLYELEDSEELFGHLTILLGRPVGGSDFEYSCSC